MTPLIIASALSLLALDAGPSTVQPVAATSDAAGQHGTDTRDDPDKVICRREAVTGSRFEKRICMSRAAWAEQARRTEELTRKLGESASRNAASAMGGGMTNAGQ